MLPNRAGFLEYVFRTHHPRNVTGDGGRRFPHQQWVRDYLDYRSPHRGLLLYHGLGVGKTCASLAAAEGFIGARRKVVVMLPASLEGNYRAEIEKCSRLGTRTWSWIELPADADAAAAAARQRALDEFHLPASATAAWVPYVPRWLPNTWVQRARVPVKSMTEDERAQVQRALAHMIDRRYTFLHYNGLTMKHLERLGERFFDDAFVIIDEVHTFISRVIHGGKIARRLYNQMLTAPRARFVLLSGTPIINQPFELAYLLNLVRGPMLEYEFSFLKNQPNVLTEEAVAEDLADAAIARHVDEWRIVRSNGTTSLRAVFLPARFERGETPGEVVWATRGRSAEVLAREMRARLESKGWHMAAGVKKHAHLALPNDEATFNEWFLDQPEGDAPHMKNVDLFQRRIMGIVSYFRSADETLFPTLLPMVVEKVPLTDHQFNHYLEARTRERRMEANQRLFARARGAGGPTASVYRAFSRMACNFVFPEDIPRPFPKDVAKALAKELAVPEEDADGAAEAGPAMEADVRRKQVKVYQEQLQAALKQLYDRREDLLSMEALEKIHAPKMAHLIRHLQSAPGKSLIYSQFRTVEGLGLLQWAMHQAGGWTELRLVRSKSGEWSVADAERVLDARFQRRRYIVFGDDAEKNGILLNLFKENWKHVPAALHAAFDRRGITSNLRGEAVAALLITQSGAEGISTNNVRNVFILEPFWNQVRIDQVIGRAVRTGSHLALPPEERNVRVVMFVSTFTQRQLKDHFTLQGLDGGKTSDEHILARAQSKHALTSMFLNAMKEAAADCLFNAAANRAERCYAFPVHTPPEEVVSWPDMAMDARPRAEETRARRMRGRVVDVQGTKYVEAQVDGETGLFDYHAWKHAKALVRVK